MIQPAKHILVLLLFVVAGGFISQSPYSSVGLTAAGFDQHTKRPCQQVANTVSLKKVSAFGALEFSAKSAGTSNNMQLPVYTSCSALAFIIIKDTTLSVGFEESQKLYRYRPTLFTQIVGSPEPDPPQYHEV